MYSKMDSLRRLFRKKASDPVAIMPMAHDKAGSSHAIKAPKAKLGLVGNVNKQGGEAAMKRGGKAHLVKGSKAAKLHMARLRAMRKK